MTTLAQIEKTHQHNMSMLEQIRDSLIEMNRVWKQHECNHSFDGSNCVHCGIRVSF